MVVLTALAILSFFCISYLIRVPPVRMAIIGMAGFAMLYCFVYHVRIQTIRGCKGSLNQCVYWPYRDLTAYLLAISINAKLNGGIVPDLEKVDSFSVGFWLYDYDSPDGKTSYRRFVESLTGQ